MSQTLLCDGCNVPAGDGGFNRYGLMTPLDYCDKCAVFVEKYLDDRDRLHTSIAQQWEDGTAAIKADVVAAHPNLRLPDDF